MTSRSFLRTPSEAAGPGDEATIQDLVDTLEANRSRCVGMAANMIGVSKRIIVFVDEDLGGRITVMLNPVITASDGAFDAQEGCLSLTGERRTLRSPYRGQLRGPSVPRPPRHLHRLDRADHPTRSRSLQRHHHLIHSVLVAAHPPLRGWSSRLRCNYIATAMTSFFMCTGGVGVLSGVGVPCAGRLASLRGVGGVMLPAVGWLASLEVLSASVMCQRVAGWLR